MSFFTVNELPATEMLPGVVRRAVYLEHAMMTFFDFAPGSVIPVHDHPHEQVTYIVEGQLTMEMGGQTYTLGPGDSLLLPGDVDHGATAIERTVVIDTFSPPREDYK